MPVVDDIITRFEAEKFLAVIPPGIGIRIAVQLFRIKSDPESFVFVEDGWADGQYTGNPFHIVHGPGRSSGPDKWLFSGDVKRWGGDTMVRPLSAGTDPDFYEPALEAQKWLVSIGATGAEARARCLAAARAWIRKDLY